MYPEDPHFERRTVATSSCHAQTASEGTFLVLRLLIELGVDYEFNLGLTVTFPSAFKRNLNIFLFAALLASELHCDLTVMHPRSTVGGTLEILFALYCTVHHLDT